MGKFSHQDLLDLASEYCEKFDSVPRHRYELGGGDDVYWEALDVSDAARRVLEKACETVGANTSSVINQHRVQASAEARRLVAETERLRGV